MSDLVISETINSPLNFCFVTVGLSLDILQMSWSRRVLVSTSLQISGLKKSWSQKVLVLTTFVYRVLQIHCQHIIWNIRLSSNQILNKTESMMDFHWRPLTRPWIITINVHSVLFLVSVSTLRPRFLSRYRSRYWDYKIHNLGIGLTTETERFIVSVSKLRLGF